MLLGQVILEEPEELVDLEGHVEQVLEVLLEPHWFALDAKTDVQLVESADDVPTNWIAKMSRFVAAICPS